MTALTKQEITGQQIIAGKACLGEGSFFNAYNPKTGEHIEPTLSVADEQQVQQALAEAEKVSVEFSQSSLGKRATFLHLCAQEFLAIREPLIARASLETGYDDERLSSEFERTYQQFLFYADVVIQGKFLDVRIDLANKNKPDLRFVKQAIGPVAVFGASNFPLAYSVAGGDTVAALAAGCPVIVKGHHSHPGTCELVAKAIVKALIQTDLPTAIFSMILAQGNHVGEQLVRAKEIKAVAFTGSFNGGVALYQLANQRPDPIPVFAEMGSLNPVVLLPEFLTNNAETLALEYSQEFTLSAGQFCVNPSLIIAVNNEGLSRFINGLLDIVNQLPAQVMLNQDIYQRYLAETEKLAMLDKVTLLTKTTLPPTQNDNGCYSYANIFQTTAQHFIDHELLHHEVFGHSTLFVVCDSVSDIEAVLTSLNGQLSGALFGSESELLKYQSLHQLMQQKVGRVVINGFTNGVSVGHATMHGGPFPATTDNRFTSVGSAAIERFIRPICFQNTPDALLPEALKNENPWQISRLVDGVLTHRNC